MPACRGTLSAPSISLRQLPAERGAALYNAVYGSPFGNDVLFDFAAELLHHEQGEYSNHVALNDLAPTLATLVGVEIPAGSSGRVLTEALRSSETATRRIDSMHVGR